MLKLARWSTSHRKTVVLGWLALRPIPAWLDRILRRVNIEGTVLPAEQAPDGPSAIPPAGKRRGARPEVATEGADG